MAKLLSVIMPIYNGATYVREAIDSVLRQTFKDFEFLIMDDGSTDETPRILRGYTEQDSRIRLFFRPRRGQITVRNELLELASCDIVACADADDVCLPDRFEHQLAAMTRNSDLWVLGTGIISINEKGSHRRKWRVRTGSATVAAELERSCCIAHPSCMMRTKNVRAIGGYRPAYECAEDYDLFLRASEHGKVDNVDVVGLLYRQHEENVSHRNRVRQAISADLAQATHLLRRAGEPDPTAGLAGPPELEDPIVATLIPAERLEHHRMMAVAFAENPSPAETDSARRYFLQAPVGKRDAIASQRAILGLLSRGRWDGLGVRLGIRAAMLGPGRLVRLAWKLRRKGPASIAAAQRTINTPAAIVVRRAGNTYLPLPNISDRGPE